MEDGDWCQILDQFYWCAFSWSKPKFVWQKQGETWFKCLQTQDQIYYKCLGPLV